MVRENGLTGKSYPSWEVMPMEQFLLDVATQVVAGILVVLIVRRWLD